MDDTPAMPLMEAYSGGFFVQYPQKWGDLELSDISFKIGTNG